MSRAPGAEEHLWVRELLRSPLTAGPGVGTPRRVRLYLSNMSVGETESPSLPCPGGLADSFPSRM